MWIINENRHEIRKKSVYHRKYHIINVMNDIAKKNNIQIGYYNREKILRIFRLIDQNSPEVNIGRKHMISVNFILKQLFDILEIELIQVYSSHKNKDDLKLLQSVVSSNL